MRAIIQLAIAVMALLVLPLRVEAAPRCIAKSSNGTGPNEKVARFQVYEGLLKSVDWGLWSQWMIDGSTPGHRVSKPVYVCRQGAGLGVSCRGRATICRL